MRDALLGTTNDRLFILTAYSGYCAISQTYARGFATTTTHDVSGFDGLYGTAILCVHASRRP
jgi:hypothetical protein